MSFINQLYEKRHLFIWINPIKGINRFNIENNFNSSPNSNLSFLLSKNINILPDTVKDAACSLLGVNLSRPVVSEDINGINELIKKKHLRSAANMCQKLILNIFENCEKIEDDPNVLFQILNLYSIRFQILMGLKEYNILIDEITPFIDLDIPEFYASFHQKLKSHELEHCSLVPFSLRLCYAEYLKYSTNPWECIPRINHLESGVKRVIEFLKTNNEMEPFIEDWNKRLLSVELMKARTLYFLKQTRLSFEVYSDLLLNMKDENLKKQILQMLTRLAITIGDEKTMEKFISELNPQAGATQFYLHKCLRAIFNGNYSYAQEQLQNISRTNDTDPAVANNLAVALLYNGNPEESVEVIKKFKDLPPEVMFTNITTLSELILPNSVDEKQALFSKWVDKLPDGYNVQEMKIFQPK
uniref:Trafficking protein particle complex subunit 12 (inferred by orthology to a human protein) n=1 Tax=Strongyloides venezuelensis TaxID=75913 RepID=A0A0K0FGC2_STRVS